jgi:phosphoribosylamine--glycine ligase
MIAQPSPARILVVGGGGREHALVWKLAGEPGVGEIVVVPGSAAIGTEPRIRCLPNVDALDPAAVVAAARAFAAELVVVGPEAPLAAGVADALVDAGIPVFGPGRSAARIETSKAFCREIAAAAGVPMARGRAFAAGELDAARAFAAGLATGGRGVVIKADGLAAGKGVVVCDDLATAEALLVGHLGPLPVGSDEPLGAARVVIEERLYGREVSVIAVADGRIALALPVARDHKRLLDGDDGPNTGGMGAHSPVADFPDSMAESIVASVHRPILTELARRGTPFRGFLYAGLILTDAGPVLLECNARLGDPEAQVILPRLAGPLGPVLLAAARGDLEPVVRSLGAVAPAAGPAPAAGSAAGSRSAALPTLPGAAVGIVLAARGYPATPERGHPIEGLDAAAAMGVLVFHAGTLGRPGGGFGTNGGRVLTVVGRGANLAAARDLAERAADAISWEGLQRRRDIAAEFAVAGVVR